MHIRGCLESILAKNKAVNKYEELHPIPPGRRPFQIVHCDYLGPFPTTLHGNQYVIGFIDNLTEFVSLKPAKNVAAASTVKKVQEFVVTFGAPERLVTDRGTCFISNSFENFSL